MRKTTSLGLGAAALAFIGTFLPVASGADATFWNSGNSDVDAFLYLILFLISMIGLFSFLANKKHLFSIGTFLSALSLFSLLAAVFILAKNDGAPATVYGTGLYILLISPLIAIITSILGFMKK